MRLLVLDGNSIINRAFYGIKLLTTKDGQYTNALYGFLNIFQKLRDQTGADHIAAAFDLPAPTFRHRLYGEYKAGRKGMPDELASQLALLKELLTLMGVTVVEAEGYEADDILGTLSAGASARGGDCFIATGDRDSLQLVDDHVTVLLAASLAGCGTSSTAPSAVSSEAPSSAASSAASEVTETAALPDGVYTAEFDTDSGMFHANEACDGKGTLTVKDGKMTFHVSLVSKKIVNLYPGLAADAEAHKTDWLLPTTDTVTYSDGTSEEVYGYDIPVTALDEDFPLAILGSKGTWYDHTVSVRNAQPTTEETSETPADGEYTVSVALEGGSGRATVDSPATLTVADGKMTATIAWSSPNYDYMVVDGEKYLPTNTEGNSTFEIPVAALGTPLAVTADTVAMSTPHEIEYTLTFTLE